MFDKDKFIACVHERPAIWEKTIKEYSDKSCRDSSWQEIGEMMYANWLTLDTQENNEKVKDMKNKWRHIRDNYQRFLNQEKSADGGLKKKKYVFADALTFLLSTMEARSTSEKAEEGAEGSGDGDRSGEERDEGCTSTRPDAGIHEPERHRERARRRQRSVTPGLTTFQEELLKKLENTPEDADRCFLISLLPDYKSLNDDEKLDFRLQILQFFKNVRRNHDSKNAPAGSSTQAWGLAPVDPYQSDHRLPMHGLFYPMPAPIPVQSSFPSTSAQPTLLSQVPPAQHNAPDFHAKVECNHS